MRISETVLSQNDVLVFPAQNAQIDATSPHALTYTGVKPLHTGKIA